MRNFLFYSLVSLFLIVTACYHEEVIEIDSSAYNKRLVVYSVISPQTDSIIVTLFETNGDFNQLFDTSAVLPTGNIVLSNETNQIKLKSIGAKPAVYACSQEDFPIEKGRTYFLTVEIDGYTKVTASTQVPQEFCQWKETPSISYGIVDYPLGGTYYSYSYTGLWNPSLNENEKNYFGYRTGGIQYQLEPTRNDSTGYRGFHYWVTDSAYYQDKNIRLLEADAHYSIIERDDYHEFSDALRQETAVEFKNGAGWRPSGRIYKNITYFLFTADEHYSNYLDMLAQYEEKHDAENDFFSSYSGIMPSVTNIEGGYGVFGSYGMDSIYFDVSENVTHY